MIWNNKLIMLSSLDYSYKLSNSTFEKFTAKTPKAKKIVIRSESKGNKSRTKAKSILKIHIDPMPTRLSFKNTSSNKISTTAVSAKNTSCKIKLNSQSIKSRKDSTRLFTNGSNRSLKLSTSPKNSHIIYDKIEYPMMNRAKFLNIVKYTSLELLKINSLQKLMKKTMDLMISMLIIY